MPAKSRTLVVLLSVTLALAGCGKAAEDAQPPAPAPERPLLGLFTTLPLMWGENADITAILDAPAAPDPARSALEARYRLAPLDELTKESLSPLTRLALIQPRILAGSENVALDDWVRVGGNVVIFADPLLTRHSQFPIGDKRRPQDVAILSPILARWGLALEEPVPGEMPEQVDLFGHSVPLRVPGRLNLIATQAPGTCALVADGLAARCEIEKGHVTVIADAALFDGEDAGPEDSKTAAALIATTFGD